MSPVEPFIADLLTRLAPRVGASLYLEPEQRRVGYLQFPSGRRCFFRDNRFDLNTLGAVNIARDKLFCSTLLRHFGHRTPNELSFWPDGKFKSAPAQRHLQDALAFAKSAGYPVYVKPNNKSQGLAVSLARTPRDLMAAAARVFAVADVAVVQTVCRGRDYRLVVLDGEMISAYERVPLAVRGDGRSTVRELLARRQQQFLRRGRDTTIRVTDDLRRRLRHLGLSLASRPPAGKTIRLLDVANLSLGGESRDVTGNTHPFYHDVVRRVAADLNLRFCGVDLITPSITKPHDGHVILEVNASPGLDNYALHAPAEQDAMVDALYLRVLRAIDAGPPPPLRAVYISS